MGQGGFVGEIALLMDGPRTASVVVLERFVDALVLRKSDFTSLSSQFPSTFAGMKQQARDRFMRLTAEVVAAARADRLRARAQALSLTRFGVMRKSLAPPTQAGSPRPAGQRQLFVAAGAEAAESEDGAAPGGAAACGVSPTLVMEDVHENGRRH
jgi:hypothetical protein